MRGNSKHGYHRHRSNKHYKKQIVQVLLDSGSDGDPVFVNKDKPMLLPYLKRLVPIVMLAVVKGDVIWHSNEFS